MVEAPIRTTSRIVVGVDASEHARRALRWARDEARVHGATLEVVHAYPPPEIAVVPMIATPPPEEEFEAAAHAVIDELVEDVGGFEGVPVIRIVRSGGAAGVLCQEAADADLVVVAPAGAAGSRGCCSGRSATRSPRTLPARS